MAQVYAGKSAQIKVSGAPVSVTKEACSNMDAGAYILYQISDETKRVVSKDYAITVYKGASSTTAVSAADYTLNYLTGLITFNAALGSTDVVKITCYYVPMSTAASCTIASFDRECEVIKYGVFGDDYKRGITGFLFGSGTLESVDVADDYYVTALLAGLPVILEVDTATGSEATMAGGNRMYALLDKATLTANATDLLKRTVGFTSSKELVKGGF